MRKKGQRTTVSMERVLADVLSLHLCGRIDVPTVGGWCQKEIENDPGAYEVSASQRLASRAVLAIAPKALQEKYWDGVEASAKANKLSSGKKKRTARGDEAHGKASRPAERRN